MKKKLLALAVAGAFVAPVAMADTANVTVYGVANVSYDLVDNGSIAGTSGTRVNKVSSNASRIGFKGSEDLGGGTNAIWQIESGVTMDANGGSTLGGRNTFAGLSGESWGSLVLGNNDSPYKTSTRKLDLFADTIADNRNLMGGVVGKSVTTATFDGRTTDSVTYTSPHMSGFAVAVQYGAANQEAVTLSSTQKGSMWSVAGGYDAGPIYVSLAYETHTANAASGATQAKEKAGRLGAAYKMDQFEANFILEHLSETTAANVDTNGHNSYYLGGKFNVSSSDAVKLAYTHAGKLNKSGVAANQDNTQASQIALGYDHAMSKRTTVYALYTKLNNSSAQSYNLGAAAYSTGGVTATGPDADPSAFSFGLKHTF